MIAYREQSHLKIFEHCVTKEKRFGYKYSCLLNKIFLLTVFYSDAYVILLKKPI